MTDIICECGHSINEHNRRKGCLHEEWCGCTLTREAIIARDWAQKLLKERDEWKERAETYLFDQDSYHRERDALLEEVKGLRSQSAAELQVIGDLSGENDVLQSKLDDAEDALRKVSDWARAYPLDIFPEPDFQRVRELLEAGGIKLDVVSASNMRHVIEGVSEIVNGALQRIRKEAK